MDSIAGYVSACLKAFNSLLESLDISANAVSDVDSQRDVDEISLLKLKNELYRFKVWSGNVGAHQEGKSSLNHRLRDASNIRAKDILTGKVAPWDQDPSFLEFVEDDSDDEPYFHIDTAASSELSQIFDSIFEDINCLFRLSISIHNPSPHDRFQKAALTDASSYEPFDVQHVREKFATASTSIVERLGKAITRRRQYFRYRELHRQKLASGLEDDVIDHVQSTVASSLPQEHNIGAPTSSALDEDAISYTGRSQTSFATSTTNMGRRHIPALPSEAENGVFECNMFSLIYAPQAHPAAAESPHLASLLGICERPKPANETAECPLCQETQSTLKQYQRHVGRHQEDLALFALPRFSDREDENICDETEGTEQAGLSESDEDDIRDNETTSGVSVKLPAETESLMLNPQIPTNDLEAKEIQPLIARLQAHGEHLSKELNEKKSSAALSEDDIASLARLEETKETIRQCLSIVDDTGTALTNEGCNTFGAEYIGNKCLSTEKGLQLCLQLSQQIDQIQLQYATAEGPTPGPHPESSMLIGEGLDGCKEYLGFALERLKRHRQKTTERIDAGSPTARASDNKVLLDNLNEEADILGRSLNLLSNIDTYLEEKISNIEKHSEGDDTIQFMVSTDDKPLHGRNHGVGLRLKQASGHFKEQSLQQIPQDFATVHLHQTGGNESSRNGSEQAMNPDTTAMSPSTSSNRRGFTLAPKPGTGPAPSSGPATT
ncbi:hypothetical protein FSARC_7474 [Fusarium sarcochroum]|uniref:Fungal N-terminal domain-containing protein n=1 Tax=Fusarium sarcochroum TaxID=1208366 RepID=A0A8H4TV92_9HYPO|nr:hypothetical protein FSARC_7474 [Fusarium sarcochroum]